MILKKIIFFLIVSLTITLAHAQDEIWLLSGEKLKVSELEFSDDNLLVRYKNEKGKTKLVSTKDLFSATPAGDKEYIFYTPTAEMSLENMKEYMTGEVAASSYKSAGAFISALGIGFASPFLVGKYAPIIPLAFSIGIGQVNPKPTKLSIDGKSEYYIKGYSHVAKRKRLVRSFVGGGIGLIGGFTTAYFISK